MNKIIALSLLAMCAFGAEVADQKPNPAIEKALAPTLAEVAKANEVYTQALAKASDKAIKELEKVKAAAMTKKDLDTANLADAKIKELKSGKLRSMLDAKDQEKAEVGDLLGEDKPITLKTKVGTGEITIVMTAKGAVCTFKGVDYKVDFTPDAPLVISGATKTYYDANGLSKTIGKMVALKVYCADIYGLSFCERGVIIFPQKEEYGQPVTLNYPKNFSIK